ncbi:unnamed protein product [Cladocopium goreaui]|uniref:MORN repeat-containing protein 4 n=1 Tax=Cladocopium goreaui TaxID=2562237 RepID=A0A9P1DV39_9DINO|nr:unnamed protein product [Cladocopium goreaui]CAI4017302.1 unnamed protein product [Cladocopium goreaui]
MGNLLLPPCCCSENGAGLVERGLSSQDAPGRNELAVSMPSMSPSMPHSHDPTEEENSAVFLDGGLRFLGKFQDGMKTGYGILERPDGSRYEGEFHEDKASSAA